MERKTWFVESLYNKKKIKNSVLKYSPKEIETKDLQGNIYDTNGRLKIIQNKTCKKQHQFIFHPTILNEIQVHTLI